MEEEYRFLMWMAVIAVVGVGLILLTSGPLSLRYQVMYYGAGGMGLLLSYLLARRHSKRSL